MFVSLLTKLVAALLVIALWGLTVTMVMSQTVLNHTYIDNQLEATNSYNRLSTALSDEIAHSPDFAAMPDAASKLQSIVTPEVLKTKLNSTLVQLQAYYHGDDPQPTLDLTDLAAQAQAAGLPIGQDSVLAKPIALGGSGQQIQRVGQTYDQANLVSLIAVAFLSVVLIALSVWRRRYKVLPSVLIAVGGLIGLLALFLMFAPSAADLFIKFNDTSNAFASIGHDLASAIARDIGKHFGIFAVIYLAIGIGGYIVAMRLQPKLSPKQNPAKARQ